MKTTVYFLLATLMLATMSCKKQSVDTATLPPFVSPPIPEWNPASASVRFDAEEGKIYRHETGSTVIIPPACLLDALGKPVSGEVELRYREFHDALDILLSGIPMAYDTAGKREYLETAGMFEVRVFQGENELSIGEGNKVQVNMASRSGEDSYNFYRLNEEERNWDFAGNREPELNFEKVAIRENIRRLSRKRRFPLGKEHFCFSYGGLLDIFLKEDWRAVAEGLRDSSLKVKVLNKAEAYGMRCLDFTVYAFVEWRGNNYPASMVVWKNLRKKEFPSWTKRYERSKFEDLGDGSYRIELYGAEEGQYFETIARLVMPLKALFAFSPEHWENQYESAMAEVESEQERLRLEAEVFRSFEVSQFGIYNWDRLQKVEDNLPLAASFQFGEDLNVQLSNPVVYYLPGTERSVIKFPRSDWNRFTLTQDPGARMLSILPGRKIAFYGPEELAAIDRDLIRQMPEPAYTFEMEVSSRELASVGELREVLGMN